MENTTTVTSTTRSEDTVGRELTTFLGVTFLISWGIGLGGSFLFGPGAYLLGVFGPTLAALWCTRRFEGNTRSVWSALGRWRVAAGWYAVAVLVPIALVAAAWASVVGTNGTWAVEDPLPIVAALGFFVVAIVVAGGPEEPGWRGYALPRLQSRRSALTASLILGAIWAIWHAPLWLMPELPFNELSFPIYAWQILAMCVVYTWLFNSTRGSVLLAVLLHASTNAAGFYLSPEILPQVALSGAWTLVAIGLIVVHGPRNLARGARIDRVAARAEVSG